jgi:spermidine synthase
VQPIDRAASPPLHDPLLWGVGLLSMAMLAFQILQVTVLGLQLLPEAGFLVVSLSMLGLGAGGSAAAFLARGTQTPPPPARLWITGIGFAVSAVACMVVTSRSHAVVPIMLASFVPYVFAGLFLATAFALRPGRTPVVYGFDLAGAAIGCWLVVSLVDGMGDAGIVVLLVGALGALAAATLALDLSRRHVAIAAAVAAGVVALVPARASLFPFGPEPLKFYGKLLAKGPAGGTLEAQRWNHLGRVDAFRPGPAIGDFDFTKDVPQLLDAGCRFRLLFSNGYNWTFTVEFPPESPLRRSYFDRFAQHLPFAFVDAPDVLNLGSGGGTDMYFATLHGARTITGVEINPLMIEAARTWAPQSWDGLWSRPEVRVVALDARTFVQTAPEAYDVVSLNAVDTGGTQASLLSTNFLYTREAFDAYLRVLRPDGVIFLTRPREQLLRAVAAAVAALRGHGTPHPEQYAVVVGNGELLSAAIYRTALGADRVDQLRRRIDAGEFTGRLQYAPGATTDANLFTEYFAAVADGREVEHLARSPRLLVPTSDDWPYFYQLDRDFLRSGAGIILRTILLVATGLGLVLIFLPLLGARRYDGPTMLAHLLYFGCLGTGFMLIEIGLVTKLGLYLGHPARALTVALATLLLASGTGSLVAARLPPRALPVVLAIIPVLVLALGPLLDGLAAARLGNPAARVAVTIGVLAPIGFALGMPFPLQLRALSEQRAALVPWAWAVNGFASVVGSVLAVAIAMNAGFRVTFAVAAGTYATALVAHWRAHRTIPS